MKISDQQIDKIIEIQKRKYRLDFESRKEAEEYLRMLCEVFNWLLRNYAKIYGRDNKTK